MHNFQVSLLFQQGVEHNQAPWLSLNQASAGLAAPPDTDPQNPEHPRARSARNTARGNAASKTHPKPSELCYWAQDEPIAGTASTEVQLPLLTYNTFCLSGE